jgi:hypothetical protein
MWDDFIQKETRLVVEAFKQHQQETVHGDEDLSLWTKDKKKLGWGGRQGPKFGAPPWGGESISGTKRDMRSVR